MLIYEVCTFGWPESVEHFGLFLNMDAALVAARTASTNDVTAGGDPETGFHVSAIGLEDTDDKGYCSLVATYRNGCLDTLNDDL